MAAETCYQSAVIAKRERLARISRLNSGRGWIPFIAKADHSFIEGTAMVELQFTGASLVSYFVIGNNSGGEGTADSVHDGETDENIVLRQRLTKVAMLLVNCS